MLLKMPDLTTGTDRHVLPNTFDTVCSIKETHFHFPTINSVVMMVYFNNHVILEPGYEEGRTD